MERNPDWKVLRNMAWKSLARRGVTWRLDTTSVALYHNRVCCVIVCVCPLLAFKEGRSAMLLLLLLLMTDDDDALALSGCCCSLRVAIQWTTTMRCACVSGVSGGWTDGRWCECDYEGERAECG